MNSVGNKGFYKHEIISGTNNRDNSGSNWSGLKKGFILEAHGDTMIVLDLEHKTDSFEYAIKKYQNNKAYFQNWLPNYEEKYKIEQSRLISKFGKLKREDYEDLIDCWENSAEANKKRIELIINGKNKPHTLKEGMVLKPTELYTLRYNKGYFRDSITITNVGDKYCTFVSDSHSLENMSKSVEILSDPVYFEVLDNNYKLKKDIETCNGKTVEIDGKKYKLNLID